MLNSTDVFDAPAEQTGREMIEEHLQARGLSEDEISARVKMLDNHSPDDQPSWCASCRTITPDRHTTDGLLPRCDECGATKYDDPDEDDPRFADDGLEEIEPEVEPPYLWSSDSGLERLLEQAGNPVKRFTTGLVELDIILRGGYGVGELVVIAGNSGSYKSMLAQHCLEMNAKRNPDVPLAFFSLEMDEKDTLLRSMAQWRNVSLEAVITAYEENRLTRDTLTAWAAAHKNIANICIPEVSIEGIERELRLAEDRFGQMPQLVVIDYLELVTNGESDSMIDQIQGVAKALKTLAKKLRVAVVVLHHTNNSCDDGRPVRRKDLRYAGYAQADKVIFTADPARWMPVTAKEQPMPAEVRERLENFVAAGVIKHRQGKAQHQGWLFSLSASGKISTPSFGTSLWYPGEDARPM